MGLATSRPSIATDPAVYAQQRRLAASTRSQERNELALLELEARVIQGDDRLEGAPADFLELKHLAHVLDHPERHHCARCCVRRPRNLLCANTRSPIAATAASGVLSIAWNILWYIERQMPPGRLVFVARSRATAAPRQIGRHTCFDR